MVLNKAKQIHRSAHQNKIATKQTYQHKPEQLHVQQIQSNTTRTAKHMSTNYTTQQAPQPNKTIPTASTKSKSKELKQHKTKYNNTKQHKAKKRKPENNASTSTGGGAKFVQTDIPRLCREPTYCFFKKLFTPWFEGVGRFNPDGYTSKTLWASSLAVPFLAKAQPIWRVPQF